MTDYALTLSDVTGRGLGPADQEAPVDQRDEREDDRADGVKVLDGIEGDAPEHTSGRIAEPPRGRELTQLIASSKTTCTLLDRAMRVAGINPGAGPEPPKRGPKHRI